MLSNRRQAPGRIGGLALLFAVAVFVPAVGDEGAEPAAVPLYTNADLRELPAPGNRTLPAAPPSGVAPVGDAAMADALQWLERRWRDVVWERDLAETRRRVREAEDNLSRVSGPFRQEGSPISRGPLNVGTMFVRGVADEGTYFDLARSRAAAEAAEARSGLRRFLAESEAAND